MKSSLLTVFNGTYTVENRITGNHRTFKIHTQPARSRFAPNQRILSVMTGSDNCNDYQRIAFIQHDGIRVWRKASDENKRLASFFWWIIAEDGGSNRYSVLHAGTCCRCNRKLTHPMSIKTGIGPVCASRQNVAEQLNLDPRIIEMVRIKAKLEGVV